MKISRRSFLKGIVAAGVSVSTPTILFSQPVNKKKVLEVKTPNGHAVFEFEDKFPDDYEDAVEWMKINWNKGNSHIYPGWRSKE